MQPSVRQGVAGTVLDALLKCIVGPLHNRVKPSSGFQHHSKGRKLKGPTQLAPCHLFDLLLHSGFVGSLSFIPQTLQGVSTQLSFSLGQSLAGGVGPSLTSFRALLNCHLLRLSPNTLLKTAVLSLLHPAQDSFLLCFLCLSFFQ